MAINLKFDLMGNPEPPSIVLANRNGNKLGQLDVNIESIDVSDKFNAASEFSFTLNKYINDEPIPLWDSVVDFKLIYCPEWDLWFEIKAELDEATETVKTVFCTQLGQAELSQIKLYNTEINTDMDIEHDDFETSVLYDKDNSKYSILHRLLEKAPHYSIVYVDESIQRIQRQFSFDDISICDAFNEISEEIGCLFVYNSNSTKDGMPNRTISVYDLQQNCNGCGHRGEFTDKCPKCGSIDIERGYGEDTEIFVSNIELATEGIQLVTDTDSVKNCFKLEAGDDLMTATIRNCNPNGSDYIWYFSDAVKEDMSDELVEAIESYDAKYKEYYDAHISNLDENLVSEYNALVEKYKEYYNTSSTCINCDYEGEFENECPSCHSGNILTGKRLQAIGTPIAGYSALMNAYYNTIDLALYLESGLMPNIEISDTKAEEQVKLLTASSLSPVAVNVEKIDSVSLATANSAVLSMAKVIVRPTYKVEINTSTLSDNKIWSGQFIVTNYSDETDTATSDTVNVTINNETEDFIKQKIEKALNKENTDDLSISGLFDEDKYDYDTFCAELKKYALNPLKSFYDACDACLSILAEQGAGDKDEKLDLYENLYEPYYKRSQAIAKEIKLREDEIAVIKGIYDETDEDNEVLITEGLQTNIINCRKEIQDALNFEDHLGDNLWLELCAYRREDKYSNSNYVSDGLNNTELFKKALEFVEVAENEIFKSAELQHSISATLNNLLVIPKFKPLVKYFKTGNWIRVQVDDRIFKLRLLEYDFSYGNLESIPVEFSDVTKIKNGTTDVKDIISQAASMASSYDSVQRQAKKGNVARNTIDQWLVDGLNSANVEIKNNNSEEVLLTKSGLLARSYSDITGEYSPEQLKITHNIMAYTDDGWETVRQAIGKHDYKFYDKDEGKFVDRIGYGMSADFVTAGVVSGSQIIGGDIYSHNYPAETINGQTVDAGSYINLETGAFSFAGGKIKYNANDNKVQLNGVVIQWDEENSPTIENVTGLGDEFEKIDSLGFTKINGQYVISPKIVGGYLSIKNDDNVGVVIDPNEDYIFQVYDGSGETTIGVKSNGDAEFSGTINSSHFIGGDLLIGDKTRVGNYAEIANDGTLTCTNANIQGGILQMGSKNNEETHTWITSDGTLNTYNANISGEIRAASGSIGGFTIETTEINEDGNKSGGWLYSGDTIGTDKSIFLSATDMNGVDGFFGGTNTNDWRLTIGSSFGVTSEGILNTYGANINGKITSIEGAIANWNITEDGIDKKDNNENPIVGMYSGDIEYISLVNSDTTSPVRFYAGAFATNSNPIRINEVRLVTSGEECNGTIYLSEEDASLYKIAKAECLTTHKLHSETNTVQVTVIANQTQTDVDGTTYYYGSSVVNVCPSWVLRSHITTLDCSNEMISVEYIGNGLVQASVSSTVSKGFSGTITIAYEFNEELNVNITFDETEIDIGLIPQTTDTDVEYDLTIEYMLDVKNQNFKVLEDGSLYASAANISGDIAALRGKIANLEIAHGGLIYNNNGTTTYSLNETGLTLEKSTAKIAIGDMTLGYDTDENSTVIETRGRLVLRGANSTQLEFMKNNDGDRASSGDIILHFKRQNAYMFYVWVTTNEPPIYDIPLNIRWRTDNYITDVVPITLKADTLQSENVSIRCDAETEGISFALPTSYNANHYVWSDYFVIHAGDYTTEVDAGYVKSFSQRESSNNLYVTGNLVPSVMSESEDTGYNLGGASNIWNDIYARNTTIQTSDRQAKQDIEPLSDNYENIFDALQPVSYKFKINNNNRTHTGFIAQDVKEAIENAGLTTQDFATYCEWTNDDGEIDCGLRYSEFIALCVNEIQKLKKRVAELENKY